MNDKILTAEQYLIKKFEEALDQVADLKIANTSLQEQIKLLEPKQIDPSEITVLPNLEVYYSFSVSTYYIKKDTIDKYREILKSKQVDKLLGYYDSYATLHTHNINAIIFISGIEFKCRINFGNNDDRNTLHHYENIDDPKKYFTDKETVKNMIWEKFVDDMDKFELKLKEETK